ncbi:melanoma-associated antigen 9-like [Muntiacus reevesi]|uniref:melanoma-associated antigen 9-like n=1 Tax=Muntiacus reevesi TaxID=9886 RepID=UPI0033072CA3
MSTRSQRHWRLDLRRGASEGEGPQRVKGRILGSERVWVRTLREDCGDSGPGEPKEPGGDVGGLSVCPDITGVPGVKVRGLTTDEELPCNTQEQPSRKTSQGSPFSPCHTPTGHKTPVIMVPTNELCTSEEDLQGQIQAQGPVEAQLLGAEAEDASIPLASFPPVSSSSAAVAAEILFKQALYVMTTELLEFLLLKYRTKEPVFQAEMLNTVLRDNQANFPVVFRKATQCLQLVFGLDVKEVDHREHIYDMVPTLGLTLNEMQRDGQSMPKAGLLLAALSKIVLAGGRIREEKIWGALSRMGIFAGIEHCIYGEPKELLTQVWVQVGYLQYRQVPYSHPARYEFLWGPRAYAETSKQQVKDYLRRVNRRGPRFFPP